MSSPMSSETLIESFLSFSTKALSMVVRLKDTEALQNELKNDYIITKELVDFSSYEPSSEETHPSRDADGYPIAGLDEEPTTNHMPST